MIEIDRDKQCLEQDPVGWGALQIGTTPASRRTCMRSDNSDQSGIHSWLLHVEPFPRVVTIPGAFPSIRREKRLKRAYCTVTPNTDDLKRFCFSDDIKIFAASIMIKRSAST
jgi:hypothetical protein